MEPCGDESAMNRRRFLDARPSPTLEKLSMSPPTSTRLRFLSACGPRQRWLPVAQRRPVAGKRLAPSRLGFILDSSLCAYVARGGNEIRRCAASNAGQQASPNRPSSLLLHVLHKEQEEIAGERVCSSAQASTGGDPGVDRTNPIRKDLCGCLEFFSNRFCCGCSCG